MNYKKGDRVRFVVMPVVGMEGEVMSDSSEAVLSTVEVKVGDFRAWVKRESIQKIVDDSYSNFFAHCPECHTNFSIKTVEKDEACRMLNERLKSTEEKCKTLFRAVGIRDDQIKVDRESIAKLNADLKLSKEDHTRIMSYKAEEIERRDRQIKDLQDQIEAIKNKSQKNPDFSLIIKDRDRDIDYLKEEVRQLNSRLEDANKTVGILEEKNNSKDSSINELHRQLKSKQDVNYTQEHHINELRSNLAQVKRKLQGVESYRDSLIESCSDRDKKISNLKKELELKGMAVSAATANHEAEVWIGRKEGTDKWHAQITFPKTLWGFVCHDQESIPKALRFLADSVESYATMYYTDRATGLVKEGK